MALLKYSANIRLMGRLKQKLPPLAPVRLLQVEKNTTLHMKRT